MILYLRLFYEFFLTGLFAIGGGMATIPFLYDMSDKTGWFTYQDLANMIAVSESTPGPIGVNMSTYVGYITGLELAGVPGAIAGALIATIGLVTPAVIIILIVASVLAKFRESKAVKDALYGLRPASAGLIAAAFVTVTVANILPEGWKLSGFNWKGLILAAVLWILTNKVKKTKKLHPVVFIVASAIIGIVFAM